MFDDSTESASKVNEGIEQPPSLNPALKRLKGKIKHHLTIDDFFNGIKNKNIAVLSRAITMIESALPEHHQIAQQIIEKCLPYSGKSIRIGITGVPGVGKSTFIETFGNYITSLGRTLAVLAIDPSSEISHGSILGDKTRMETLSVNQNAFIRPSPSSGSLGGVANKTRETIILCEAAGFNTIIIETVGVGQSETAVHSMVDFFLLLMLAGAGDELQGIKRGIMEMADAIAITKADGNNETKARQAGIEYQNALHLFPPAESGWIPKVVTCSATQNIGISQIWNLVKNYFDEMSDKGFVLHRRQLQSKFWMYETINESLKENFYQKPEIKKELMFFEELVLQGKMTPHSAAANLLKDYLK